MTRAVALAVFALALLLGNAAAGVVVPDPAQGRIAQPALASRTGLGMFRRSTAPVN